MQSCIWIPRDITERRVLSGSDRMGGENPCIWWYIGRGDDRKMGVRGNLEIVHQVVKNQLTD